MLLLLTAWRRSRDLGAGVGRYVTAILDLVGLAATALIVYGCYLISLPLAFIVGGVLLFLWALAVLVHYEEKS